MEPIQGTPAVILSLLRDSPRQAQDLAAQIGIDTSAVRRHLESLRAEGLVEATDHVEGRGRPKKLYALTVEGRERFPRDYALLIDLLLRKVEAAHGRADLERVVELVARDLGRSVEGRTSAQRADAMLALYNRLGFEAALERRGRALALEQRNCIFLKTARADPQLLCRCLDEGIIRAALPGAKIELESSLAMGDARCRHLIRLPARPRA